MLELASSEEQQEKVKHAGPGTVETPGDSIKKMSKLVLRVPEGKEWQKE